jgi:hypothetical protein
MQTRPNSRTGVFDGLRVPYAAARARGGDAHLRPHLPIRLQHEDCSAEAIGLVDSGADVNVLPLAVGSLLGLDWSGAFTPLRLSGNFGRYEARAVILDVSIGGLPTTRLSFAWTRTDDVPLLLGQVNFFTEFDVCFFRSRGFLEVRRRSHPSAAST